MTKKEIIKFLEDNSKELFLETLRNKVDSKAHKDNLIRWATAHKILKKVNPDFDEHIEWAELEYKHTEKVKKFFKTKESRPYFWKGLFKGKLPTHIIK